MDWASRHDSILYGVHNGSKHRRTACRPPGRNNHNKSPYCQRRLFEIRPLGPCLATLRWRGLHYSDDESILSIKIVLKRRRVVLSAVEHANDRNPPGGHGKCDHRPSLVIRDQQARADIVALGSAQWKRIQGFAVADDGIYLALGYAGRGRRGDVAV